MSARVLLGPDSITSFSIDWGELVTKPMAEGYYIQAFASADAIIDDHLELILRQIYSDFNSQSLINQLNSVKGKINFDGSGIAAILENKKVISGDLRSKIIKFKSARNLVSHNPEAEYRLVPTEEIIKIKTQEEFDNLAKMRANKNLGDAFAIFTSLLKISEDIHNKKHSKKLLNSSVNFK